MKLRSSAPSLVAFSLLAGASVAAANCTSSSHGASSSTAAGDSGPKPSDEGGAAASDAAVAFQYAPAGCAYTFTPSTTRPFTSYALDTSTAASADDAGGPSPQLVRVGLSGNTTKGAAGYADATTTAAFSWITTGPNTNAKVRIGTTPNGPNSVHAGYVYTSPPPTTGVFGENEPPAYFHEVDVCGLSPATTYYYQVGGGAAGQEVWSAQQSFTTVPATGTITVGVFGDARDTVSTWQLVGERMRGIAPNLMLVSGDIVDVGQEESLYTEWLGAIWQEPSDAGQFITLGQFMMIPTPGNHEQDTSQFFANFPIPGFGDYAKQYASFDIGNTHFAMVDDQPIGEDPGGAAATAILTWLDADLDAANKDRANHPFIVTVSHRCLFSTASHAKDPDVIQARASLVPIFDKYHVDLAMNGHDHEYERSFPLNAGNPPSGAPVIQSSVTTGTTYVINAGAGADPYQPNTNPASYRDGNPTGFGSYGPDGGSSPYVGCYTLLTLGGTTLTLTSYGMKAGGGSVAGDDVIDTLTFGQ